MHEEVESEREKERQYFGFRGKNESEERGGEGTHANEKVESGSPI